MSLYLELKGDFIKDVKLQELRKFGLIIGPIFVILGFLGVIHRSLLFLYFGLVVMFLGLFVPASLEWFYKIWIGIGTVLGFFMSRVILVGCYFCVILPVGLIRRVVGGSIINKNKKSHQATYWVKKKNE